MARDYGSTVFDELAIVRMVKGKFYLEWYEGPRREAFQRHFHAETGDLKASAAAYRTHQYAVGEFAFTHAGDGSKTDAFIKLGEEAFLICGNTRLNMTEITANRRWLLAQQAFAALSERVVAAPVQFAAPPTGPCL
jgi:hypothetical protein